MRRTMLFVLIVVLSSVWLVCSPTYAQDKAISLKLANFFPPDNKISVVMDQWCKEVEKRTNGAVKVTQFTGGTLTPPAQTYISVTRGVTDIGLSFFSYTMGRFPIMEALDLPLGYRSAYVATKLANEFYKKFKPKELDEVKVLFLTTSPPHMLFAKKPVKNLEDLKGLKIRSTGTSAKVVAALGGVPVSMPMSEAYDALSKGVAQGIIGPYEPMKGFRLAEVVDNSTEYGSAYVNANYIVMNKDKWNSLPANIQKIIEQINDEWVEKMGKLWDELDKEGKDVFLQKGGKAVVLSKEENAKWSAKLRPILDEYVAGMKAKGLPADEALKFCQDYLAKNQK
ncbi:MAG: TRAP-type C4-dicarboxylate transport system, periplasmic component [Deltaproteobacteria bacterium]|jgi:TRAP-type C4-dicarboxylate transport system substrate-binding protein|nr:TRAP-type C4-dicarboxylate transport system, periplasmic component [Deltaproteobacteria bacterium]